MRVVKKFVYCSIVWPVVASRSLQHDYYNCKMFNGSVAFPTRRLLGPNNFVGACVKLRMTITEECPLRCRPLQHTDWVKC